VSVYTTVEVVKRKLRKHGNSIVISIPKKWLRNKNIKEGDFVIIVFNDVLLIEGVKNEG